VLTEIVFIFNRLNPCCDNDEKNAMFLALRGAQHFRHRPNLPVTCMVRAGRPARSLITVRDHRFPGSVGIEPAVVGRQ